MKNKYNPYTVPEGFFELCNCEAVSGYRRRRRILRRGFAMAALLVILLAVPAFFMREPVNGVQEEVYTNNLAEMYEYDIFLQVNF